MSVIFIKVFNHPVPHQYQMNPVSLLIKCQNPHLHTLHVGSHKMIYSMETEVRFPVREEQSY